MIRHAAVLLLCSIASLLHAESVGQQWSSHGPAGGETRVLVAARANPEILYVASAGGVFRSDDGGSSWRTITGPVLDPVELAIAPSDADVVIAASGASKTLYRSGDGGAQWRVIGAGLPPSADISAIAIDPRNANIVYAGARCGAIFGRGPVVQWHEAAGLFKSVDGGATFFNSSSGMTGFQVCVQDLSIDPRNPDSLYATPIYGDSGWARSDDAGATWHTAPDRARVPGGDVVYDPGNPRVGFGATHGTVIMSTDGGKHWELRVPTHLETGRVAQFGSVHAVALDPAVPRLFIGSDDGTYRTGDAVATILPLAGPAREKTLGVVINDVTGALTIGTESGVHQSAGWPWDQWRLLDTGDRSRPMQSVLPSRRDARTVYAATSTHLFVTRDDGLTWMPYAGPLPDYRFDQRMRFEAIDANDTIYAIGTNDNGSETLFRKTLGSSTWTPIPPPLFHTIRRVYVNDDEPSIVYANSFETTFRTADGGTTWEPAVPRIQTPREAIDDPVISRADPDVVYVSGREPGSFKFVLYRSTDGGQTWTANAVPNDEHVWSVAADPRLAGTVYIATTRGDVYRSRNGGVTWTLLTANLPRGVQEIALNHDGSILHVATDRGMWERQVRTSRRRPVGPAASRP